MEEISIGEFARRSRLSLRALRLYDERGVLVPSRVDQASGYRHYDTAQLDEARLVVMLRELQLPLAAVKELLACDPADAAARIAEHWRGAEAAHDARRELADYLVSRLSGKRPVMYEVATREIPERSLLWSHPSADGDGLIEWCRPVPAGEAHTLAEHYPELTLRTEPAHREAFVALPAGFQAVHWQLAAESLEAWGQEQEQEHEDERLTLKPEDLGLRTTYLATGPSDPGIDLAVPFA